MLWTTKQKIFIVEAYFRQKSIHAAQLQFKERFGCREFSVWFSDEAHFLLSGHVNSKNNIFWGRTPPEHCVQRPLHCEVHCLGCHLQTWHHWTILVRGRQRAVCYNQHRAICPGAWQVLDSTWSTERGRRGPPVVPAGWCHPPHLKRIIGMATAAFPWPTDQPRV